MTLILEAQERNVTGKKVGDLREQGLVPAVVYGKEISPQNLTVQINPFTKLYKEAGENTLVDLKVGDKEAVKVLIQDIQIDPTSGKISHVDLRQIRMTDKIETEISLKFIGEAPVVKEVGGTLIKSLDSIEIKCLPQDLVHEIKVDVSALKTFEDAIQVKDLKIPAGIEVLTDLESTIATVEAPLTEEELKAELETPAVEKVEEVQVIEKEKKEEGETASAEEKKE